MEHPVHDPQYKCHVELQLLQLLSICDDYNELKHPMWALYSQLKYFGLINMLSLHKQQHSHKDIYD